MKRHDPYGRELVEECEAFLQGRYVERLVDIGEPVPSWAWTNLLAHGTEEQLASPPMLGRPSSRLRTWSEGRAFLAAEVLDHARMFGSLATLQQAVLVPLELDLAAGPMEPDLRPRVWIDVLQRRVSNREPHERDAAG